MSVKEPTLAWLGGRFGSSPWLSKSVVVKAPGNEMPAARSQSNQGVLKSVRTAGAAAFAAEPSVPSATATYAPPTPVTCRGAMSGPWKISML